MNPDQVAMNVDDELGTTATSKGIHLTEDTKKKVAKVDEQLKSNFSCYTRAVERQNNRAMTSHCFKKAGYRQT